MTLMSVIQFLVPGAICATHDENHLKTVWLDARPMPTQSEIDSAKLVLAGTLANKNINDSADVALAKHRADAFPLVLSVLTKLATGQDKAALAVFDASVKAELAKKV